jgi:hypothetical protein
MREERHQRPYQNISNKLLLGHLRRPPENSSDLACPHATLFRTRKQELQGVTPELFHTEILTDGPSGN